MRKLVSLIFGVCGMLYGTTGRAEIMCCPQDKQCGDVCCPNAGCNDAGTACRRCRVDQIDNGVCMCSGDTFFDRLTDTCMSMQDCLETGGCKEGGGSYWACYSTSTYGYIVNPDGTCKAPVSCAEEGGCVADGTPDYCFYPQPSDGRYADVANNYRCVSISECTTKWVEDSNGHMGPQMGYLNDWAYGYECITGNSGIYPDSQDPTITHNIWECSGYGGCLYQNEWGFSCQQNSMSMPDPYYAGYTLKGLCESAPVPPAGDVSLCGSSGLIERDYGTYELIDCGYYGLGNYVDCNGICRCASCPYDSGYHCLPGYGYGENC